jgi:hypothetical protein
VAFNKCDQPLAVPQDQLHVAFNLSAVAASYPGSFCSLHTSATTGQGAGEVAAWMAACQQQVAAAAKAGSPRVSLLGAAAGSVKAAARQLSVGWGSAVKRNAVVPVCDEEDAVSAPAPTDAATATAPAPAAAAAAADSAAGAQQADGEDSMHAVGGQRQQQQPQQQQGTATEQATCVIQLQGQQAELQQGPKQQVLVSSSEQAGQQTHEQCIPGVV